MKIFQQNGNKSLTVVLLLSLLIGVCYSNSFNASWHLDDYPNINNNSNLHLESLTFDAIQSCFFNAPPGGLYRPIAYFTFALNWFWGRDHVTGYHVVNIIIHILTAFFLFLTIRQLLMTPNSNTRYRQKAYFIALLATAMWAIHPIQIQAVTYIVQRMASLVALFYVIAIWAYISGRRCTIRHKRIVWYAMCLMAWFLALGTKQNAVMLPAILALIEVSFIQDWEKPIIKQCYWWGILFGVAVVTGAVIFLLLSGDAGPFMGKYKVRPFTPMERLLTQFRVMFFYLSQIVYPIPSKFSITHDFLLSRSFLTPWTTLPCILTVIGMIGAAVWAITKGPLLKIFGFAILFFFLNHLIESTILPLEIVFEHRNYLPTIFLFLPVAIGVKNIFDHYQKQSRPMFFFLVLSTCALLISIGISTYLRNMDWQSEKTLWQDAMAKAPLSARPSHNLAWAHYTPAGQLDTAIALYHHALKLQDDSIGFESTLYFNMAAIYYSPLRDFEKTIEYSRKTLQINGNHVRAVYLLAESFAWLGRYDDALKMMGKNGDKNKKNPNNMYLKGLISLNMSKPELALGLFRQCLAFGPHNWQYLREVGFSLSMMNLHNQANWFFRRANALRPNQPEILLGIAATRLAVGFLQAAENGIDQFISAVGTENIEIYLINAIKNPLGLPIPYQRLKPLIARSLIKKSDFYSDISHRLLRSLDDD